MDYYEHFYSNKYMYIFLILFIIVLFVFLYFIFKSSKNMFVINQVCPDYWVDESGKNDGSNCVNKKK